MREHFFHLFSFFFKPIRRTGSLNEHATPRVRYSEVCHFHSSSRKSVFPEQVEKTVPREKHGKNGKTIPKKKRIHCANTFFAPLAFLKSPSDVRDRLTSTPPHWSATQKFEIFILACKKAVSRKFSVKKKISQNFFLCFLRKSAKKCEKVRNRAKKCQ